MLKPTFKPVDFPCVVAGLNTNFWKPELLVFKNYLSLTLVTQYGSMILSFGSKDTEMIWNGVRVKGIPLPIQEVGRRKLRMLNNALDLSDLRIPPANRLEKLSGNMKHFYSIRINEQWRVIFQWSAGNVREVEIIDYH